MAQHTIIHLVEPDELLRQSLRRFLESLAFSVQLHPSAEAFLDAWQRGIPGCIVTELFLPGMTGLELQQRVGEDVDGLPIVFVSEYADVATAVQAVQKGAAGFLTKPFAKHALLENIRLALRRDHERRVRDEERREVQARINALTPRERELLDCVMEGLRNREIAERLGLNLKTVEMHRSRMMKKMQAQTLIDLVRVFQLVHPDVPGQLPSVAHRRTQA